jgi:hypothetical protein
MFPQGKSPLMPAQMSPDSVVLDMYFARFPFGDTEVNEKLWQEIDEQQIAPEVRERLTRNGFRVGVIGGQMPAALTKILELTDKTDATVKNQGVTVKNLQTEPRVQWRHLQIRPDQPAEIIASSIYPELTVLLSRYGRVSGQNYTQAQGIFALKSLPQPDGRVRLELTPELHHDQPAPHWVGSQGVIRMESDRPKQIFDDMTIAADLSPGWMLVLSSLPNRPGSLGHSFFTQDSDGLEQKLLVIRLQQTQHDGLILPAEPAKSEE